MDSIKVAYFPKNFNREFCIKVLEKGFDHFRDEHDMVYTPVRYNFNKRNKVVLFANILQKTGMQSYLNLNEWQKIELKNNKEHINGL